MANRTILRTKRHMLNCVWHAWNHSGKILHYSWHQDTGIVSYRPKVPVRWRNQQTLACVIFISAPIVAFVLRVTASVGSGRRHGQSSRVCEETYAVQCLIWLLFCSVSTNENQCSRRLLQKFNCQKLKHRTQCIFPWDNSVNCGRVSDLAMRGHSEHCLAVDISRRSWK